MDVSLFRWIAGCTLALVFLVAAGGNAVIVVLALTTKRKPPSLVPLVGGLAGGAAALLLPVPALWSYWFWPPLVDVGCVPAVVGFVVGMAKHGAGKGRSDREP